ncbi:MAG: TrmH family RNA methyltransferase [Acidimicrobiales bacterium]|jgi:tRNA (guanosine-2'-O-)-methyltransferase|nr:TrmH family RNA methyltransferase [Acidimicrobiales bacterium]MDP6298653.1 TrmH family RNA methyltransferase [Acidimicrobiales bacterium]HJM28867.1 TrmH family RNA methyltransferase [Acidimicrobiales bacterium]HJM97251.1 TrmH family RNA methyltransferase [Acidimicrobiales bacterium]
MDEILSSTELKRLHRQWRKKTYRRVSLIIVGVQGPYNVGSIIRTAAAERVEHIWFVSGSTTPDNSKTGKTALGSERYIQWDEIDDESAAIELARLQGYKIVGLELSSEAEPIHIANLEGDVCLLVGHEDRGIPSTLLEQCDLVTYIPQLGKIGSLNVAIATSIAVYEVRRQEWMKEIE